jgi:hypothetical protein
MITQKELWGLFSYDGEEGVLRYRETRGPKAMKGRAAGGRELGYIRIVVAGKAYMAHRLIWLWIYGEWPTHQLDHIDRDRSNNRIENLREATPAQNRANCPTPCTNKSGYIGVSWKAGHKKWVAQCRVGNTKRHLGYFNTAEAASEAYQAFASQLRGAFHPT